MVTTMSDRARSRAPATARRPRRAAPVPFWFAVPCLLVFAVIVAYPTVQGTVYAFTDWSGLGSAIHFNGVSNFVELFRDPQTRTALTNTLLMAACITIAQNAIGLGLAAGLHSRIKSRNVLRTLLFAPVVMTPIIVGYLWQFIFVPGGPVATAARVLGLGPDVNVLGSPTTAIWGVMVVVIWQFSGYSMVIYLAGMQNIPSEITEAAALDGAGPLQRFRYVTWPLLRTPALISVTLSLIASLKLFDQVIATTQGGPGYSTQTLSTMLYNEAFLYNRYGYGIAFGLIVFVLIAAVTFGQMRAFRERG